MGVSLQIDGKAEGSPLIFQIIKEYERAVVFRLGRIQADKAKGPGRRVRMSVTTAVASRECPRRKHRKLETLFLGQPIEVDPLGILVGETAS